MTQCRNEMIEYLKAPLSTYLPDCLTDQDEDNMNSVLDFMVDKAAVALDRLTGTVGVESRRGYSLS